MKVGPDIGPPGRVPASISRARHSRTLPVTAPWSPQPRYPHLGVVLASIGAPRVPLTFLFTYIRLLFMEATGDQLVDVSVKVPVARVGEFYEMFGRWLRSDAASTSPGPEEAVADQVAWDATRDLDLAASAWSKFPDRAKAVFGTLLENPGRTFTGDELSALHNIPNGRSGVAGVLAHPGRQLKKIGRKHHFVYATNDAGEGVYSMTTEMAELFGQARRQSQGS